MFDKRLEKIGFKLSTINRYSMMNDAHAHMEKFQKHVSIRTHKAKIYVLQLHSNVKKRSKTGLMRLLL